MKLISPQIYDILKTRTLRLKVEGIDTMSGSFFVLFLFRIKNIQKEKITIFHFIQKKRIFFSRRITIDDPSETNVLFAITKEIGGKEGLKS